MPYFALFGSCLKIAWANREKESERAHKLKATSIVIKSIKFFCYFASSRGELRRKALISFLSFCMCTRVSFDVNIKFSLNNFFFVRC